MRWLGFNWGRPRRFRNRDSICLRALARSIVFTFVNERIAFMSSIVPLGMSSHIADHLRDISDDMLVAAAKSGDSMAFQELSKRHTYRLTLQINRVTRNWQDAEDAVQEATLRAFLHLNRFEGRSTFSTWLTRIAINSALMSLRKKRCMEQPIAPDLAEEVTSRAWDPIEARPTPEQELMKREREQLLTESIRLLRAPLRTVMLLQQTRDCSIRDIAGIMGISVPAVKSRMARAKTELRKMMSSNVSPTPTS
jgi:RNA polymerase sigma factor (sigma-70 family)